MPQELRPFEIAKLRKVGSHVATSVAAGHREFDFAGRLGGDGANAEYLAARLPSLALCVVWREQLCAPGVLRVGAVQWSAAEQADIRPDGTCRVGQAVAAQQF
jgi:hypothetical protein